MTKLLRIADDLTLPPEFVTQAAAIIAKRRVGKSYLSRRIAEQLLAAKQQVVIADPKGDWWGIRTNASGDGPGYPVIILGGERGDLPLKVDAGEVVAQMVVEDRVSILLDLSDFRKHEVKTFMTAFMESLYRMKAREQYRTPVMLIIDEADAIAPQKPNPGEERMVGAASDIVRRGGQRGIGCLMITQRTAVLNKDLLTQCEVLVALRTISPQDLKAMQAWIDVHGTDEQRKELMASLPSLPVGTAWFWSPGWPTAHGIFQKVEVLPITTYDSGKTPEPGTKQVKPVYDATKVDLAVLEKRMADAIEEKKASDPVVLNARIRQLETQLSKTHAKQEDMEPIIRREVDRHTAGWKKVLESRMGVAASEIIKVASLLEGAVPRLEAIADMLRTPLPTATASIPAPAAKRTSAPARVSHSVSDDRELARRQTGTTTFTELVPVQQKILNTIAGFMQQLGVKEPDRETVAAMCGYHPRAKSFANALGALKTAGYVDYPSTGRLTLTSVGVEHSQAGLPVNRLSDLHQLWYDKLGNVSEKILRPLIEAYPKPMVTDDLAIAVGYHPRAKAFANAKGRLRTLGLIDYPTGGYVVATEILFPKGLR